MAIENGDILRIADNQTLLGKSILNVYWYQIDAIDPNEITYDKIGIAFTNNVLADVAVPQVDNLLHTNLLIENVTNGIDEHTYITNVSGSVVANVNDLSTAISFTLRRTNKSTRNGGKRIGGIADNAFDNNTLQPDYVLLANDIAAAMGATITMTVVGIGTIGVLHPVIVGRLPDGKPDISRVQDIAEVTYHTGASTQVSRKVLG